MILQKMTCLWLIFTDHSRILLLVFPLSTFAYLILELFLYLSNVMNTAIAFLLSLRGYILNKHPSLTCFLNTVHTSPLNVWTYLLQMAFTCSRDVSPWKHNHRRSLVTNIISFEEWMNEWMNGLSTHLTVSEV